MTKSDTIKRFFEDNKMGFADHSAIKSLSIRGGLFMYLRGKRYENEKKIRGGQGGNRFIKVESHLNDDSVKYNKLENQTRTILAKEYGVAPATIERDGKFAKGIDLLPKEAKSVFKHRFNP